MATMTQKHHQYIDTNHAMSGPKLSVWAVPFGRCLYALIFILAGLNHFTAGSIEHAEVVGVPMASLLVPLAGAMAVVGGVSIALGMHARIGAMIIMAFLIPVTLMMHQFWVLPDPIESQMQLIHFLKNVALFGGAIIIAFYGSGPVSLDQHRWKKHHADERKEYV